MRSSLTLLTLLACLLAFALPGRPAGAAEIPPIAISTLGDGTDLFGRAEFLMERGGPMSVDAALRAEGWEPATEAEKKRGLTEAKVWMRFRVVNDTGAAQEIVVTHDIQRLTDFTAFAISPDGASVRADYDPVQAYDDRPLAYAGPVAMLTIPAGAQRDIVVRFGNDHPIPIHLNLRLWSEIGFERHAAANTAFFVFWIGCLVTAASFWMLYGVFMRQIRMTVYAVYMTAVASTYVIFSGVGLQFLLPGNAWFQHLGFNWAVFLMTCSAYEFARRHLEIARLHPRHNLILRGAVAFYAAATVLAFPSRFPAMETALVYFSVMTMPLYMTWLSWGAWRRDGLSYASWMVFGWGGVTATTVLTAVFTAAFLPFLAISHIVAVRLTFASIVVESLLLSASLAQWLRGQEIRRIAAEHAASRDSLTGLLNRRGFDDHVARLRADGLWPGNLWLVLIDLDRFKLINDAHSHAAGDAVLTHFSNILRREFRANDVTARFGGEEFVLLFEAGSEAAARAVAERVCRRFADTPTRFDGKSISHTLSAGLVRVADGPSDDEGTLIAMADTALYAAKRSGRNCVHLYSEGEDTASANDPGAAKVVALQPAEQPVTARS